MRPWTWRVIGAFLYCLGLATVARSVQSFEIDCRVPIAKKAPKDPTCPGCAPTVANAE